VQLTCFNQRVDTPKDPNQVNDIVGRIKALWAKGGPEGLPKEPENVDNTNEDRPLNKDLPRDIGWQTKDMITGNGNGPELGGGVAVGLI
jgi:hypothetical protein